MEAVLADAVAVALRMDPPDDRSASRSTSASTMLTPRPVRRPRSASRFGATFAVSRESVRNLKQAPIGTSTSRQRTVSRRGSFCAPLRQRTGRILGRWASSPDRPSYRGRAPSEPASPHRCGVRERRILPVPLRDPREHRLRRSGTSDEACAGKARGGVRRSLPPVRLAGSMGDRSGPAGERLAFWSGSAGASASSRSSPRTVSKDGSSRSGSSMWRSRRCIERCNCGPHLPMRCAS